MSGKERNAPTRGRGRARSAVQPPSTRGSNLPPNLQAGRPAIPRTSGPETLSPERTPTSFFQKSRNVAIHGGHFVSDGGNHISVIFNGPQAYLDPVPGNAYPNNAADNAYLDPRARNESLMNGISPQTGDAPSTARYPPAPAANYNTRSPLPVQKSSDIYYRHIAAKGRGSPLWIPQANNQLPVEYRRIGTQIGDIGIITAFGGFDFLFNIFLPAGHVMQSEVLPQGFKPLDPLRSADVHGRAEFDRNSYLASSSIERSQHENDASGLTFQSSESEGAVLAMPHGLNSRELSNVAVARQYLQDHLENIYRFANGTLGREVKNGDLCLVIGCDKTNAWGIATFARSTSQQELHLKFKPTVAETGNLGGSKYQWEYSGVAAEVRSGPGAQEVEQLRRDPDSNPFEHENQCLFIRTLNSVLSNDIWRRLEASKFGILDVPPSPKLNGTTAGTPWKTNSSHSSFSSLNLDSSTENVSVLSSSQSQEDVRTSEVDVALALHPSRHINNYLLRQNPNARMAITEDSNWMSVLEKDEAVLPPPDSMLKRILQSYDAAVQDGIVFLRAKLVKPPPNIWHLRAKKMAAARAAGSSQNTSISNDTTFPSRSQSIPQSSLHVNPWLTQSTTSTANSAGLPPDLTSSAAIATMNATTRALQDPENWPELGKQALPTGKQTSPSSSHPLRPSLPPPESVLLSTSLNTAKPSNPFPNPWSPTTDETTTTSSSCPSRKANAPVFTSSPVRPQLVVEAHGSDGTLLSKPPPNIWTIRAEKMAAARAAASSQKMSVSNAIALTSRSRSDSKSSLHGREKKWAASQREELPAATDGVQKAPWQISSSSNLRYPLHPSRPQHTPRRTVCPKSPKPTTGGLNSRHKDRVVS